MKSLPVTNVFGLISAAFLFSAMAAQGRETDSLSSPGASRHIDAAPAPVAEEPARTGAPLFDVNPKPDPESESDSSPQSGSRPRCDSVTPTSVMEGIHFSVDRGDKPEERIVTYYFIFRNQPSSYSHDVKFKEKKLVFEFNDTKWSAAPVLLKMEPPLESYFIDERIINAGRKKDDSKPEYHTQVRVEFALSAIPKISAYDDYNVVSFSYTWSADPAKAGDYAEKNFSKKAVLVSSAAVAGIGGGFLTYYLFLRSKPKSEEGLISTDDLPSHNRK